MQIRKLFYLLPLVIIVANSCSRNNYKATNKSHKRQLKEFSKLLRQYPLHDSVSNAPYFAGTTNFSTRRPNFVVIHHTAQNTCDQTLRTFTLPRTAVSSHYVICRDGIVFHMLNDMLRAHHAGVSKWGNNSDLNSSSIGIEIDNNGSEPFTEVQMNGLLDLLGRLKRAYNIPSANFIGHADVAPGRKVDPSRFFPWKQLADAGYGLWYDTTNIKVSPSFNALQALRIIGYNTSDSIAAIQSFKIHFVPEDTLSRITLTDKKILADLINKY
jgi:N-acetylmuramoyl-L-alanine amidase